MTRLRLELDRLGLKAVRLRLDERLASQGLFQPTGDGAFEIVIGASLDERATLGHEAIHALRALGVFQDAEWAVLVRRAANGRPARERAPKPNRNFEPRGAP